MPGDASAFRNSHVAIPRLGGYHGMLAYADDNSINRIDPTGHSAIDIASAALPRRRQLGATGQSGLIPIATNGRIC